MDKPIPNFVFKFDLLWIRIRDFLLPRRNILEEVRIKPGFYILDYGCGPGGYTIAAAELVESSGKIYALDIHPLAVRQVQDIALKKRLTNIKTICSDCATGLPSSSVDIFQRPPYERR